MLKYVLITRASAISSVIFLGCSTDVGIIWEIKINKRDVGRSSTHGADKNSINNFIREI